MFRLFVLFFLFSVNIAFGSIQFKAKYIVDEDYNLCPVKINNSGLIVGTTVKDGNWRAFSFDSIRNKLTLLAHIDEAASVSDLNDNGDILGFVEIEEFSPNLGRYKEMHACIWNEDAITDLKYNLGLYNNIY